MHLEEAKNLQTEATQLIKDSLRTVTAYGDSGDLDFERPLFPPAIGINPTIEGKYKLAIRLADKKTGYELIKPLLNKIPEEKIDLQITGLIVPFGSSITMVPVSHREYWLNGQGLRGTIGCLVRKRDSSELMILSNQHIFAQSNNAREHDSIIAFKENSNEAYQEIALLKDYIKLKNNEPNSVDAAIAYFTNAEQTIKEYSIEEFGVFKGFHNKESLESLNYNLSLSKRGMKTGLTTQGTITGFDFNCDNPITVEYMHHGICSFVDVLEIKSQEPEQLFSQPGDSGSIIYDNDGYAVALLFAGNSSTGLTYAIPISTVLEALDIELVLSDDNQQLKI